MIQNLPNRLTIFQYSFLALPLAFAGLPLYIHAPDFYTHHLGLNIGLIGATLLIIRLFDAIQDPIIGYISDKYTQYRYHIMLGGMSALIIGITGLFYGPPPTLSIIIWFALTMTLATTGFSIVAINFNMIGGLWINNTEQRTRISAWREVFSLIGLLIAASLPAILQNIYSPNNAFKTLSWVFITVSIVGFVIFTLFAKKESVNKLRTNNNVRFRFLFFSILNGNQRKFFLSCFLAHLAAALPGILVIFFIQDYLNAENLTGVFLILYFLSGAALMGVWVFLAKKFGKEKSWLFSMLLSVITFSWALTLGTGDVISYGIICVLSGMALGADLSLPPSIIADRITKEKSEQQATQHYAALTFIPKVAIAIASGLAFILLDKLGFIAGENNTDSALKGMLILYAFIPCLLKLSAAYILWRDIKNIQKLIERTYNDNTERTNSNELHDFTKRL